jgi:4-amino-4-deoxy-L-arabinose transferase-like glycosyltransferase
MQIKGTEGGKIGFGLSPWVAFAAIAFVYVLLRVNVVDVPLDRDEGVFGYAGQVILDGGLPYRDVLDHKPPVVFYLNALALLLIPPTARGVHVFLHAYNFITLVALFFIARSYTRSRAAGLWTAFCYAIISSSPAVQGGTASTEMFMLLPLTLSLLFAVLSVNREGMAYPLLSGVAGGIAFWTRQTALFPLVFCVLYLILVRSSSGQGDENHEMKNPLLPLPYGCLAPWW